MSKKTVVITGSSRGIGRACAILFAKNNYNVVINYNKSKELAEELFNDLKEAGYSVDIFKADISNRFEANSLINHCIGNWNEMMGTNLNGIFYTTQKALQYMLPECSGKIINISSIWGMVGGSYEVHYSTSKAAIIGMTKALAKELGPSNIQVNCIAPGVIQTDMLNDIDEEIIEGLREETPLMRIGTVDDIANCALFLASDKSDFITGQVISPNGGFVI